MSSISLTEKECQIVATCLRAAVEGPFFPDWEFHTLFGLARTGVRAVADRYPGIDKCDEELTGNDDSWLAINNTLANLLGYPHGIEADWSFWIPVSRDGVEHIFKKWKQ